MNKLILNKSLLPFIFIFPLLRNADISYLIGIFSFFSLFSLIKNKPNVKKLDIFISLIPILILLSSALYRVPNEIDVSSYQSFFFYPLIQIAFLPFGKFEEELIDNSLKVFIISVFGLCFISVGYILFNYDISYILASNLNGSNLRILVEQIPYFGNSPIYLSLYILITFIIIIEKYRVFDSIVIFGVLFFTLIFFILFSKTQIVIFLLYITYKIYKYLNSKSFKIKIGVTLIVIGIIFFVFTYTPFIYNRIYEMYVFAKMPNGLSTSSTSLRLAILNCSCSLIRDFPFFGVGLLNLKHYLNFCYSSYNVIAFKNTMFFTHNQFLFYFVSSGFVGGVIFFIFIFSSLRHIFWNNRTLFIILCVIVGSMFTEDIFLRQKGITIFATFLFLGYNRAKHV